MAYIITPACLNSFVARLTSELQYLKVGLSHAVDFVFLLAVLAFECLHKSATLPFVGRQCG
jgi:hypothetical protein